MSGGAVGAGLDVKTLEQLSKGNKHQRRVFKRLATLEQDLSAATLECQDMAEKYRTSESVKEFLAARLKDKEAEVRAAVQAKQLAEAQSLSDREVIVYLDGRVRSLEQGMQDAQAHLKEYVRTCVPTGSWWTPLTDLCVCPSVCLSACLSVCLSVCLFVFVYLCVCVRVCRVCVLQCWPESRNGTNGLHTAHQSPQGHAGAGGCGEEARATHVQERKETVNW